MRDLQEARACVRTCPRANRAECREPSLLDEEGYELVLVGVDDEPERALGIDLLPGERAAGADTPA